MLSQILYVHIRDATETIPKKYVRNSEIGKNKCFKFFPNCVSNFFTNNLTHFMEEKDGFFFKFLTTKIFLKNNKKQQQQQNIVNLIEAFAHRSYETDGVPGVSANYRNYQSSSQEEDCRSVPALRSAAT